MIKRVCVYCASSDNIDDIYTKDAELLGALLGKKNINVINGAGRRGLMRVISDAAISAGGSVTGVIPDFMCENGWCHPNLTDIIRTKTMHERKKTMAELSDAAIALPGGYGTLEELLEIITWKQLKLYNNPIIILNTNNYYNPLFEMFRSATEQKFMREKQSVFWHVAQTPEEVLDIIDKGFYPHNKHIVNC